MRLPACIGLGLLGLGTWLGSAGCGGALRLTNPPRQAAASTDGEIARGHVVDRFAAPSEKYRGDLQLPLAEDWAAALPDEGRWAVSRLEVGAAFVDGDEVWIGSSRRAGLSILDRASGRLVRTLQTSGPVQCPPARIGEERVVVDTFGQVRRLGPDGAERWAWAAPAGVFRTPSVIEGRIYLALGNDTAAALDAETGAVAWIHKRAVARTSQELAILGAPTPVVVDGTAIVGFSDGLVAGFGAADGVERWRVQVGRGKFPDIQAEPIASASVIVAAAFGGPMVGLDPQTLQARWTLEDVGAVATMASDDLGLVTADGRGRLVAVDPRTGAIQWTWELADTQLGPPTIHGDAVFVGDVSGTLHAVDRRTGEAKYKLQPADGTRLAGIAAAPTVDGRQILIPTAGGRLLSLMGAAPSGETLGEHASHRPDRPLGW